MRTTTRGALLVTTIIAGLAATGPAAYAQAPKPAPAQANSAPPEDESSTIVVTGSLISNPNLAQSSPVNVTTSEEIQLQQSNVAEDVLRTIPGVVPNMGPAMNNGTTGAAFVDLRGLGSNRNIVLLDGFRIVPAGLQGQVDLNNIPLALVDRVDALTGGASTTYGADAISGVVNFITRGSFSGFEASVGEQITEKGDGNYARADVTIGANFDDGRGNAVLSVGYQESDPVYQGDRPFSERAIDSFNGTFAGSGTSVPARFSGTRGLAAGAPSTTPAFTQVGTRADGTPILAPAATGAANGGVRQLDPTGSAVATYAFFNFNPYNVFQTPFRRYNMFGSARYEISDSVEAYARGMYSKNTVRQIIAPSGIFNSAMTVPLSNPYLPAALRNQFCALNVAPVVVGVDASGAPVSGQATYVPFLTPTQCAAAAAATSPTDPNYRTVTTNVTRRLVEGGPRISEFTTTVFDYRIGLRGGITDSIRYDLSASYGESENRQTQSNYILTSRAAQALLATNTSTCLSNTNGCIPLNVFGPAGSITAQQAAFLQQDSSTLVRTTLAQVRGIVNGDLGLSSPGARLPVSFAVGGEYRRYGASQRADSLAKIPGELGGAGGAAPDIDGGYEVYEAIGEFVAPLVQDRPFFDDLTAKAGVRYSSYTVDAPTRPKFQATTYKGELVWAPFRDIKFRGGYSRSVRAPNINELFEPVRTGLLNLSVDPCAGNAPVANPNLRAVCIAQGAPAVTIGSILNPSAGQANSTGGGNPNAKPEKSDSFTVGAVITPTFAPGLSLSVDYYNIRVTDAITRPTTGDVLRNCFGTVTASSAASPACLAIRRNPATGGLDGDPASTQGLATPLTNLGKLSTDGIDVSLNYRRDLGFARLAISFMGNYTFRSKAQAIAKTNPTFPTQSIDRECVGFYSVNCASIQPRFQWSQRTTLTFDKVDVSLLWRHIDAVRQEPDDIANGNGPAFKGNLPGFGEVDFGRIKAYDYFDLATRFEVLDNLEVTMTVQNLFNRKPPVVGYTIGATAFNSGNTYPTTYDTLGRKFAVGAKVKF